MQPMYLQVLDLFLFQLTNFRWSWRRTIILGSIVPVLGIVVFSRFITEGDASLLAYVFVGNLVLSILFETIGKVSSRFAYMRVSGILSYLATLPIYRTAVILATVLAFFILSLPAFVATVILGRFILKIHLVLSPWIIVVVPLISVSLSGLGAFIGLTGRTPEEVGSMSTLITFFLYVDRLSPAMRVLSFLSPTTYAASALRQVMLKHPDHIPLYVDIIVLVVVTLAFLFFVGRQLEWRQT